MIYGRGAWCGNYVREDRAKWISGLLTCGRACAGAYEINTLARRLGAPCRSVTKRPGIVNRVIEDTKRSKRGESR